MATASSISTEARERCRTRFAEFFAITLVRTETTPCSEEGAIVLDASRDAWAIAARGNEGRPRIAHVISAAVAPHALAQRRHFSTVANSFETAAGAA
jgi:hypothetical protein